MALNTITIQQLPRGFVKNPYYRAWSKETCDLCNWHTGLANSRDFWLCDEHARELGHLW